MQEFFKCFEKVFITSFVEMLNYHYM